MSAIGPKRNHQFDRYKGVVGYLSDAGAALNQLARRPVTQMMSLQGRDLNGIVANCDQPERRMPLHSANRNKPRLLRNAALSR